MECLSRWQHNSTSSKERNALYLPCIHLMIQTPSLLHMSKLLVLDEIYLFTELRDMLMNKVSHGIYFMICEILSLIVLLFQGACSERRVLATTANSTIQSYDHISSQCQPPHSKRMRRDCGSCDMPLPQSKSHDVPLLQYTNSDFISYKVWLKS